LPWGYRNADITFFALGIPIYVTLRNTSFATVTGACVLAASGLLQQVSEACGWLELYCRLHYVLRMAAARPVAVLPIMAAVVVVSLRRVLVGRLVVFVGGVGAHARDRRDRFEMREEVVMTVQAGMQKGSCGHYGDGPGAKVDMQPPLCSNRSRARLAGEAPFPLTVHNIHTSHEQHIRTGAIQHH
jgi:hypothetical protein